MKGILARLTVWRVVFACLVGAGLYATFVRFFHGLGAATNLSDSFPWGLWIGFDVLVGVGLAAGGFVIAATVHIFQLEKYEPIARPTILTAFLGYLLVMVALLYDLGHPYRIWHPLVMWNPHSVMFEVAWCVTLYTIVLALEFSPLVFERFGLTVPLRVVRMVYVPLVIVGVLLSTLHQSSLGTLYVIAPERLHDLWYTSLLPVFFFLTAIAGGLAMVILESYLSYRAYGKRLETDLLQGLGRVIVVLLGVYAIWKLLDLVERGNLALLFDMSPESVLFLGEVGLGVLLPMVLFSIPRVRENDHGLLFAALLTIMGFVIGRLNVAITGMQASAGAPYFPSWMELAVTAMLFAIGFFLFAAAVKHLPIFVLPASGREAGPGGSAVDVPRPILHGWGLVALWALLIAGAVSVGFAIKRDAAGDAAGTGDLQGVLAPPVHVASPQLTFPAAYTFPTSEDSPGPVTFSHESHVEGGEASCTPCHAGTFRITQAGLPLSGTLDEDRIHEGDLCASCHNDDRAFGIEEGCESCHEE